MIPLIIILILLLFFATQTGDVPSAQKDLIAKKVKRDFQGLATVYGFSLPVNRILAIICVESQGNPAASGTSGERGLMQLKQGALDDGNSYAGSSYTWDGLFDARTNIFIGSAYLRFLMRSLTDMDTATRAYNVGIGNLRNNPQLGFSYLTKVKDYEIRISKSVI